jgi:Fuc2NAc and GlcNAc transferase
MIHLSILYLSAIIPITALGLFFYYKKATVLDIPNHRSVHEQPILRGSGIVLSCIFMVFLTCLTLTEQLPHALAESLLIGTLGFSILGFMDDLRGLSIKKRLALQFFFALLILYTLYPFYPLHPIAWINTLPLWFALPFILISIIWSVNLYNFMDGSDGIASVHACVLSTTMCYLFWMQDAHALTLITACLSLLASVFLLGFNRPGHALLFLGDSGSYFFGAIFGILALVSSNYSTITWFSWLFLHALFITDTFWTLLLRIVKKATYFTPHQTFTHHILLLRHDWSKGQLFICYLVIDCVIAMWLIVQKGQVQTTQFLLLYSILSGLFLIVRTIQPKKKKIKK